MTTALNSVRAWYEAQVERVNDGEYKIALVPDTESDDVINRDDDSNLGYWTMERIYEALGDDATPEQADEAWSEVTGLPVEPW